MYSCLRIFWGLLDERAVSLTGSYEQDGVYEEPLAIKGDLSEAFPPPPPPICLSESERQSLSQVSQTWSSRKSE